MKFRWNAAVVRLVLSSSRKEREREKDVHALRIMAFFRGRSYRRERDVAVLPPLAVYRTDRDVWKIKFIRLSYWVEPLSWCWLKGIWLMPGRKVGDWVNVSGLYTFLIYTIFRKNDGLIRWLKNIVCAKWQVIVQKLWRKPRVEVETYSFE